MDIKENIDCIIRNFEELKKTTPKIEEIANVCINAIKNDNKILLCGNGGSASDAQHIAAELVVKYKTIRKPLPAIALTTDTSILTAIGNDMGAEMIFERQVDALGKKGDILICITTSGNSQNIIEALLTAKTKGLTSIVLTGNDGGEAKNIANITLNAPSNITNNIQEMHIAIGHILCDIIEKHFAK